MDVAISGTLITGLAIAAGAVLLRKRITWCRREKPSKSNGQDNLDPSICQLWSPSLPIELPQISSQRQYVLLIRHAHRLGGKFPTVDGLTPEGKEAALLLGRNLCDAGVTIDVVIHSAAKRNKETATQLVAGIKSGGGTVPSVVVSQLLGYDGPFVANKELAHKIYVKARSERNDEYLHRIVEGGHIPGHHPRRVGVQRMALDIACIARSLQGPRMDNKKKGLIVGLSHDSIIAGVAAQLGLPHNRWPDPLNGILVDIETLLAPSHGIPTLDDPVLPAKIAKLPITATMDLPTCFNASRKTLAIYGIEGTDGEVAFHDHSMVLMEGGNVHAMVELERVSRKKQDSKLASSWLDQGLTKLQKHYGLKAEEVDVVIVNSMTHNKIKSSSGKFVVETEVSTPNSTEEVAKLQPAKCTWNGKQVPAVVVSHELAHVFSALPFPGSIDFQTRGSTLLVHFDGAASQGNFSAWSFEARTCKLTLLQCHWELSRLSKHFNDNGLCFAILGESKDRHLSVPGKLMGLQSYGKADQKLKDWLKAHDYFRTCWTDAQRRQFVADAKEAFDWVPVDRDRPFDPKDRFLQDVVATLQSDFTETFVEHIKKLRDETKARALYLSGGCALNICTISQLEEQKLFDEVFVPPCCSDTGLALGGAAFVEFLKGGEANRVPAVFPHSPYLNNVGLESNPQPLPPRAVNCKKISEAVLQEKVVGVCQGWGECGPRALGNRSILALPTTDLRDRISLQMKQREWYRPIAPVMLLHNALKVTGRSTMPPTSKYMLSQFTILPKFRKSMAGVVHHDGTARIQVLFERSNNPLIWDVLEEVEKSGVDALINTSFNRRGEPIVHTEQDALATARAMRLDVLYAFGKISIPDPLRILVVNHGYPPTYNAGSEIYAQALAHKLHFEGHQVAVFARREDPYQPDFIVEKQADPQEENIDVYLMNHARSNARFQHREADAAFEEVVKKFQPNIVHFNHLNHLSTSMVAIAKKLTNGVVFTLHDFWLACPRGQFLQWGLCSSEPFKLCNGQENSKCASKCFNRFTTGIDVDEKNDTKYFESWVGRRMDTIQEVCGLVDVFIAPSEYLAKRMSSELPALKPKIELLDYGFRVNQLPRRPQSFRAIRGLRGLVFGYTGRHHPSKGVSDLIKAFFQLEGGDSVLRIWGRNEGQMTSSLKKLAAGLQEESKSKNILGGKRLEFKPEYTNKDVSSAVFSQCDVLVVPSIWGENSPLVIHEALQCRVPVITADIGGMHEFVKDEVNGLNFRHRDVTSLAKALQRALDDPGDLFRKAQRGYLQHESGDVLSSTEEVASIQEIYYNLVRPPPTPWRITFDTNITQCNLNCTMCEGFSVYKPAEELKAQRKKKNSRIMDITIVEQTLEECMGKDDSTLREIIPSTMGEPLMYLDFNKIIDQCIDGVKLNLTTNGTFPNKGPIKWANEILPHASDVKISWNGATKEVMEEVMRGSKWEKRVQDLELFLKVREEKGYEASVTLQCTFLECTMGDLPDLVDFAIDHGIDRLKGHHLWSFYKENEEENMRRSADSIRHWNKVAEECQKRAKARLLPSTKRHKPKHIKLQNFELLNEADAGGAVDDSWECPFLGKEAWVSPEGVFSPCCAPEEQRKELGDFGNLHQKSFLQIWEGPEYRELLRNYKNKSLCKTCLLRRPPESDQSTALQAKQNIEVDIEQERGAGADQSWSRSKVSHDGRFHVLKTTLEPLYNQQFQHVMSFHHPGLAAVQERPDEQNSYHIKQNGEPAYSERYARTFGFYQGVAAVVDGDGSYIFIYPNGSPAFSNLPQHQWKWAGNFGQDTCTVRSNDGLYYYINLEGIVTGGPFLYAGDVGTNRISVVRQLTDGRCLYIDHDNFCHPVKDEAGATFLSLTPLHKEIGVARDEGGWFHVDARRKELFSRQQRATSPPTPQSTEIKSDVNKNEEILEGERFEELEPFYNGFAFFTDKLGRIGVLSEAGKKDYFETNKELNEGITVITATAFNDKRAMMQALKTVKKQNIERLVVHLIVGDNLDETKLQSLRKISSNFPNVRVLNTLRSIEAPDSSVSGRISKLRNVGVAKATTRFVAFLDDDNTFTPDHLTSLCNAIENAPENGRVSIAHSYRRLFLRDGKEWDGKMWPWKVPALSNEKTVQWLEAEGVVSKPGSGRRNEVRDISILSNGRAGTVDTNEILAERDLFLKVPWPEDMTREHDKAGISEDGLLLRHLVKAKENIGCSESFTVNYVLGGRFSKHFRSQHSGQGCGPIGDMEDMF